MSTLMEDRLTAALHARAELVQPEDLRHQSLQPTSSTPLWRRPVVIALVAAAAAVAVVVPLVLTSRHDRDLPADKIPTPVHSLTGDVDRDGKPDHVSTSGTTLTLTRASDPGHPTTARVSHLAGLIGFVDAGVYGRGIVVATKGLTVKGGRAWEVYIVRGGGELGGLSMSFGSYDGPPDGSRDGLGIGVVPGRAIAWITSDGRLMSGTLDPSQIGAQKLAVDVGTFVLKDDELTEKDLGDWCWDTATQGVPEPCPAGVSDAFDPGPHGSLPALLPVATPDWVGSIGSGSDSWHDGRTRLRIVKGRPHTSTVFDQVFLVTGTVDGRPVSARLGTGGPRLLKTFVDLGHGVRGLVAPNDATGTWNLLAVTDRGLVPLVPADRAGRTTLHPGTIGVRVDGTPRGARTLVADGKVFTRVETGDVGRYHVYEWQVTDSSGARLTAVDLGTVCIDDFQGSYGTCAG